MPIDRPTRELEAADPTALCLRLPGGAEHVVTQAGLSIGRELSNDVVVSSPKTSRRHARVSIGENSVLLADLGSRNGTCVNGRRIDAPTTIAPGDVVTVGGVDIEVAHLVG